MRTHLRSSCATAATDTGEGAACGPGGHRDRAWHPAEGLERFDDWGQVKVREPNRVIESVRSFDFCSQDCLNDWWHRVDEAVSIANAEEAN